jgi:hypothetical protein
MSKGATLEISPSGPLLETTFRDRWTNRFDGGARLSEVGDLRELDPCRLGEHT